MFGICQRLAKSKVLKTPKMAHLSSFSFMAVTPLKSPISHGTPTTPGSFAPCLRITSCKCGKWQKIFTTTKKLTLLLLKTLPNRHHSQLLMYNYYVSINKIDFRHQSFNFSYLLIKSCLVNSCNFVFWSIQILIHLVQFKTWSLNFNFDWLFSEIFW